MTSHAREAAKVADKLAALTETHPSDVKQEAIDRLKAAAEGIKAAGEAASAVSYGPQGGNMDYRYRYEADYHYTTHVGEDRRRPAGFGQED